MKAFITSLVLMVGLSVNAGGRLNSDIIDTAVANGGFKTLVAAVQAADLVAPLKSEGPFTVFAPTDAAFAELPEGTVESLLNDIPALTNILKYHVYAGEKSLRQFTKKRTVKTLQGQNVAIRKVGNRYFVNESEVLGIVKVSNGQIIVIDQVLLPK